MKRQKRRASQHSCPDQPITATAPHFSPPAAAPAATVPAPPTEADCQESDAERVKKYELLNQIGHEVLNRELDRAKRKEETAARYFAVFALLLGVTTSLGRDVVKQSIPPHDRYQ